MRYANPNYAAESGEPRRSVFKSKLTFAVLAIAGAGAAVAGFFAAAPPSALFQDELAAAIKKQSGRDLKIGGASSFTLFPPGIAMQKVSLSGPPGMDGTPTVEMASLEASVAPWPLLSRRFEITRLVLRAPVFEMRIDKQGRKSWDFSINDSPRPVRFAEAASPSPHDDSGGANLMSAGASSERSNLGGLTLGSVEIENGTIRYVDERKDLTREASAITATVALPSPSGPLSAKGRATWAGEEIAFNGAINDPSALGDGAKLALDVTGKPVEASYDGLLTLKDEAAFDGAITAKGPSSARFAEWLGVKFPFSRGRDGPFSFAGKIATGPDTVKIGDAKFDMDGVAATGSITVETGGKRPFWRGKLAVAELDLDKNRPDGQADVQRETKSDRDAPAGSARSIDDLLRRDGTKVKGYSRRAGWSEEPIDWSNLGEADANLELDVGRLRHEGVEAGPGRITLALKDKNLEAAFEDMALYRGKSRGVLKVDASREPASLAVDASADDVDMGRFLGDASDLDWLSGSGQIAVAIDGRGKSERQIVETLNGTAKIDIANGAVAGWNLDKLVRSVSDGKLPSLERKPSEKTAFEKMNASFKIKNGVADNQDLALASPLLRVSGAGKVLLAKRELDYMLKPKLTANGGGAAAGSSLEIPVRLTGSWAKPKFAANFDGVLKNPDKAIDAIKEIGKKLKGKKFGDIVRGLLGDDNGGKGQPAGAPEPGN